MWNDKFELRDGSYSISDIQDYFRYILKKHGKNIDNVSKRMYVNNIEICMDLLQVNHLAIY